MRTRFLNVDFLSDVTNPSFLHLPIPSVPLPNLCDQTNFLSSNSISSLSYFDVQGFEIDQVLSRFLSDVLPHRIDDDRAPPLHSDECRGSGSKRTEFQIREKNVELLSRDTGEDVQEGSGSRALELDNGKKSTDIEEQERSFRLFQFETPETLSFFKEQSCVCLKENGEIFLDAAVIETPLDIDCNNIEEAIPYPQTISESVHSVHEIAAEYCMLKKDSFVAEYLPFTSRGSLSSIKCPLLEVNELSLELEKCSVIENELHLLLEDMEHWDHKQNAVIDGCELLGSSDVDILECLSEHILLPKYLDEEPQSLNIVLEVEFINVNMATSFEGNSVGRPEVSDGGTFTVTSPVHFQENQIFELDISQKFEEVLGLEIAQDAETCDHIFEENSHSISSFYESFVSHELVLMNDSFISLPIPLLLNDLDLWSVSTKFGEILADLEPCPPSASDVIYLDWHLLLKDRCTLDICLTCWSRLEEVDDYDTGTELRCITDAVIIHDIICRNDALVKKKILEKKEIINDLVWDAATHYSVKDEPFNTRTRKSALEKNGEGPAAHLFESKSQFNDLNFFLNPGKDTMRRNVKPTAIKEIENVEAKLPLVSFIDRTGACGSTEVTSLKWQIKVQEIRLSDYIVSLIRNIRNSYLEIIKDDNDLKRRLCTFSVVDDFELLNLPQQKLMDWIKESGGGRITNSFHKNETFVTLVALYVIKQMASYLCFYGIDIAYLYIEYISKSFKWLRHKLSLLQSLVEEAHVRIMNDISKSHPSLSAIEEILGSTTSQSGSKVLVIADRVFWLPLKGLFTLMGLSSVGLKDSEAYSYYIKDALSSEELINCKWDSLLSSSCLLLSHENVSASFPFDKFNCILEYSGSRGFSTISNISSKLAGLPCVHFLKLEVDDSHVPKGLCEGVNACVDPELSGVEILESTCTLHEDIKLKNLEHFLNYAPVGDKCIHLESKEPMENKERSNVSLSVRTLQFTEASEQLKAIPSSFPDIVVIVNTRDFGKEMLISRRSTYQKILAIEKGRAQVVEREIDLPADLILSAEMCLLWYDCKNILKKETFESDPSLCIPPCVENIAMNILTSLSFAFSTCVLIFEGERSSLGSIMESSDELYAAAASLGLDLQIFFTYSSELTDDIILSSIDCVSKSNGRMYPKMSESETLAESFLATFPSINSLSAHAILSSGGMLVEFLRWSLDARIRAVRRYHVPEESVALFSALCRYGEQEESKSGMTECSSVSSAADSGNSSPKVEPQRKKQKQFISIDVAVGEDVGGGHGALNQLIEDDLKSSRASKPYQSSIFERIPDLSNDVQRSNSSLNARLFCQPQGLDSSENSLDWSDTDKTQNLSRSTGKVVDHGRSFLDEDFSIEKNTFLKMRETEMGNDLEFANSYGPKKLFVGLNDHPDFLTTREVKHNFDIWDSTKDHNGELEEELCNDVDVSLKKNMLPFDRRRKSLEKEVERYTRNTKSVEFPLNVSRQYDRTPLSKAIHSSRPPQGSPWTMEFLNKIKEKTKMHQRSLLCNNASSRLGYNDNMERFAKRKSPSILNFYRYQGGNSSNKISKQKKEMHSENSVSSSKNIMHSTALFPSSTPVDKKAKRTLTFARDGTETQSKLVWSKGNFGVLDEKTL